MYLAPGTVGTKKSLRSIICCRTYARILPRIKVLHETQNSFWLGRKGNQKRLCLYERTRKLHMTWGRGKTHNWPTLALFLHMATTFLFLSFFLFFDKEHSRAKISNEVIHRVYFSKHFIWQNIRAASQNESLQKTFFFHLVSEQKNSLPKKPTFTDHLESCWQCSQPPIKNNNCLSIVHFYFSIRGRLLFSKVHSQTGLRCFCLLSLPLFLK